MARRAVSVPAGSAASGTLLALLAAVGLGLAVAMARYAYEGGANGITVATTRAVLLCLGLALFLWLSGRSLYLPPWARLHCAGLGMLMGVMFYGNIGAVEFIPVNLTALLFFTYPPMIAAISAVVVRERVSPARGAAIVVAFAGLALMLGVSLTAVDPRGVALALSAAACCAWNAVWLARKVGQEDSLIVTLHMAVVAALLLLAVLFVSDSFQLPDQGIGWFGFCSVVLLQGSSLPIYFMAIPRIGAMRSAMLTNVQPVWTICIAYVLFGEVLTPWQWVGGALVLGSIVFMQWSDRRRDRAAGL